MTIHETPSFVYYIPAERFVYKTGGKWAFHSPVSKAGITHWLLSHKWDEEQISVVLKGYLYPKVVGTDIFAGKGELVEESGSTWINLWKAPTLEPKEGAYPNIERILDWLTGHDAGGVEWLCHWLALKVQNPEIVPKVAVVMGTQPGAGKGTLYRVIQEMLGEDNCTNIGRAALESQFNARWAQKLFCLADEVVSNDNSPDVANRLKMLIDSTYIELEGKGKDQVSVKNRLAWIFASNDKISPVVVEDGDRRYTVFTNYDDVASDYVEAVNSLYQEDRVTVTPEFYAEIQAFYHDLLNLKVDLGLVRYPFVTKAKKGLINANAPSHDLFFERFQKAGLDKIIQDVAPFCDYRFLQDRNVWSTEDTIQEQALYRLFTAYTRHIGGKAMRMNRFLTALNNNRPVWEPLKKNGDTYYHFPTTKETP